MTQAGVRCIAEAENTNGHTVFDGLAPGAYLVLQSESAAGYESMLPFLLVLPQMLDGEIVYDVTANAKPVSPLPPGEQTFTAKKTVEVRSGTAPKDTVFSFVLTAATPQSPLPNNPEAVYNAQENSMTVSRVGAGDIWFGRLAFTDADAGKAYSYTLREAQGTAARYTYDQTVYRMTVSVDRSADGKSLVVTSVLTDANGKTADSAVFRNFYDGGDTPTIPRTGQLWWPVLLMLPAGIALAAFGAVLLRRSGKEEDAI